VPSLDADDLAMISGLLDDGMRPRALKALIVSRSLVVDTTLASVRRMAVFGSPPSDGPE